MLHKNMALALALAVSCSISFASPATKSLLRIEHATPEILQLIVDQGLDVDNVRGLGSASGFLPEGVPQIDLWASADEVLWLESNGISAHGIRNEAHEMWQWLQDNPVDATRDDRAYHNHADLTTALQDLATANPTLCHLESIGNSVQGREIWAMKVSDNPTVEEDEPEFRFMATIHGDEPVGTEMCVYMIETLVAGYGTDTRITNLVDNVELWFVPMYNPDGNALGQRYNANGYDLNRNFPDWYDDRDNTTSGRPLEVGLLMEWSWQHNFILSTMYHGGAQVANYPWDNNETGSSVFSPTPDEDVAYAVSYLYASTNTYLLNGGFTDGITNGAEWYSVSGGVQDWCYSMGGEMCITMELSNTKWPSYTTLDNYWAANEEGMFAMAEFCLRGVRGIVTDANTGLPLDDVNVYLDDREFPTYTDGAVGDYHRLAMPGTYSLTFEKDGYFSQTVSSVSVGSGAATVVDVQLVPETPQPELLLTSIEILDGNDGMLDPGESAQLQVTVLNDGTDIAYAASALLSTTSPWLTISSTGTQSLGQMNPSASSTASWSIEVDSEAPAGAIVGFDLQMNCTGSSFSDSFQRTIGLEGEDFESAGFESWPWTQGSYPWTIVADPSGVSSYAAKSGSITHSQDSELQITHTSTMADEISFRRAVSSESGYDYLKFYVDGSEVDSWSGTVSWATVSYTVSAGTHTYKWAYEKDVNTSSGSDCAWIDDIVFPTTAPPVFPELALSDSDFEMYLEPGTSGSQSLTISNAGDGELEWQMQVAIASRMAREAEPEVKLAKGEQGTSGAVSRDTGGPDTFGHIWMDSNEAGGPEFSWVDISSSGTPLDLADDESVSVSMGMNFPFYGNEYSSVRVCSNGFLSFTSTATAYTNGSIPSSTDPDNLLAVMWDDFSPNQAGTVYYKNTGTAFVVQWQGVYHYDTSTPETFQVLLYADGSILYQYLSANSVASCTIGIENADGSDGIEIVENSSYLSSGLAILFSIPEEETPWLTLSTLSGSVLPGGSAQVDLLYDAAELELGDYVATLQLTSNDPDNTSLSLPVSLHVGPISVDTPVVSITANGTTLHLEWTPVSCDYYRIESADTQEGAWSTVASTGASSYDIAVPVGELGFFRVVAVIE